MSRRSHRLRRARRARHRRRRARALVCVRARCVVSDDRDSSVPPTSISRRATQARGDHESALADARSKRSTADGDAMAMIYELMSKQRDNDMSSGEAKRRSAIESSRIAQAAEGARRPQETGRRPSATPRCGASSGRSRRRRDRRLVRSRRSCSCGAASGLCVACVRRSRRLPSRRARHTCSRRSPAIPTPTRRFRSVAGIGAAICSWRRRHRQPCRCGSDDRNWRPWCVRPDRRASCCRSLNRASALSTTRACRDAAMAFGIGGVACAR